MTDRQAHSHTTHTRKPNIDVPAAAAADDDAPPRPEPAAVVEAVVAVVVGCSVLVLLRLRPVLVEVGAGAVACFGFVLWGVVRHTRQAVSTHSNNTRRPTEAHLHKVDEVAPARMVLAVAPLQPRVHRRG